MKNDHAVRGGRFRGPVWVAVAVAVGLVLAPTAAVATSIGLNQLVGPNGTHAVVSRAGQLSVSPADPNLFRTFVEFDLSESESCVTAYKVPKGYSFVLTNVTVDTYVESSAGLGQNTAVFVSKGSTACHTQIGDVNAPGVGDITIPFTPGFVIPAGSSVDVAAGGTIESEVYGQGYLVPVTAAPGETPQSHAGALDGVRQRG
jgi:hypothetical protein